MNFHDRVKALDWVRIYENLESKGFALADELLTSAECAQLAASYNSPKLFRSTINMVRYNFGLGEYKYFSYPLPALVQEIRESMYPFLAILANQWATALRTESSWPTQHATVEPPTNQRLYVTSRLAGGAKPPPQNLHTSLKRYVP